MADGYKRHQRQRYGESQWTGNVEIPESPISQQSDDCDTERLDDGTDVEIIVELGQEVTDEQCQPSCLEIAGNVVWGPEKQLVLLLEEEMVRIPELEECPARNSPENYRGYGIPNFGRSVDENHPHSSVDGPVSASLQFKLSPNPSRGQVTLFSAESQPDAVVSVYTLLGKKLYCGPVDDPATASTLSSLQQGIYLLRVISSGNSQTLRMIRQ